MGRSGGAWHRRNSLKEGSVCRHGLKASVEMLAQPAQDSCAHDERLACYSCTPGCRSRPLPSTQGTRQRAAALRFGMGQWQEPMRPQRRRGSCGAMGRPAGSPWLRAIL